MVQKMHIEFDSKMYQDLARVTSEKPFTHCKQVYYVKLDFMSELVSNTNFTSILDAKQIQREQIILQMIKEITYNKKINIKLIAQAQASAAII